jgi:CubicO group peptidase (beta-lactamase class C family)
LKPAADYLVQWLEFQLRLHEQPGCVVALAYRGRLVLERAFGYADAAKRVTLTPRHRFRVASHSKSFTAAAIMSLVERKKPALDDRVGRYLGELHPQIARATLAELLSHSAGLVRDGSDSGQFVDRRPFLSAAEVKSDLSAPPILKRSNRFKYSNHGYALLGLVIEQVTGERYRTWIERELIARLGLAETFVDMPIAPRTPFARGHSAKLPAGRRMVIPGDFTTNAIAPAGGFVSTAADLVRFFGQLAPGATKSMLSPASRRAMIRKRWRDPHSSIERYYGLGIVSGTLAAWPWFGHSGGLQGYITRTVVLPTHDVALSILANSIDAPTYLWVDGAMHILRAFAREGPPARRLRDWKGRWWTIWNALDLVPVGTKVLAANPAYFNPFLDATELEVRSRDSGRIALASGYASHGEPARLVREPGGAVAEVWLGGTRYVREAALAREMEDRYGAAS